MQDPSYDPYGFAKVATRTASSEAGSAAACAANVQKFFQTLFQLAPTRAGRVQINQDLKLCTNSMVTSTDQMNQTLAQFVQGQWVSAVSPPLCLCYLLPDCVLTWSAAHPAHPTCQVHRHIPPTKHPQMHTRAHQRHASPQQCTLCSPALPRHAAFGPDP